MEVAAGEYPGRIGVGVGIDPDHAEVRVHAMQIVDHRDIHGAIAASAGKAYAGMPFRRQSPQPVLDA